ncbi:hypothetical protein BC833DRAFT_553814 [Globomyces pollinis-pini]|nr:hypothetical protein BC833DRAFT_553814 [Globomyces pollinis-pini]
MRQDNAYLAASAMIIGIAYHNSASALVLILSKATTAGKGALWRLALLAWLVTTAFVVFQTIILDFITSPYPVPDWWVGFIQLMNFVFHFLTTVALVAMMMTRLSVFYKKGSNFMISMYIMSFIVILVKLVGESYATVMSLSIMNNTYLRYEEHPYYPISQGMLAASGTSEMIFSIVGSVGFLNALNTSVGGSRQQFIQEVLIKHEGYRLVLLTVLYTIFATFLIYGANFQHTPLTHCVFYLPSWIYALELRTFLELSYVSAKEIILKQANTSSREHEVTYDLDPKRSLEQKRKTTPKSFSQPSYNSHQSHQASEDTHINQQKPAYNEPNSPYAYNPYSSSQTRNEDYLPLQNRPGTPTQYRQDSPSQYRHEQLPYQQNSPAYRQDSAGTYQNQESPLPRVNSNRSGYTTSSIQRHVVDKQNQNVPQFF